MTSTDVTGREVRVGSMVAVAFSYSRASVGRQRIGVIKTLEPVFTVTWEDNGKDSPPMVFDNQRLVLL